MPIEIVAAHAGLAWHASGHNTDARALDIGVGVRALERAVETFDRSRLRDIERLALRQALGHVEYHHVAELFEPDEVSERAADHATADQRDLGPRHSANLLWKLEP